MKKFFWLFLFLFLTNISYSSTEASRFAEKQYVSECKLKRVHIVVKKEHTLDYSQTIGKNKTKAITYGYGDLKIKGYKKSRISYICLLDKDNKPFWSYIIRTK